MRVLNVLAEGRQPSIDELIGTMEMMMQDGYFTPEQLADLKERHRAVGADAFAGWKRRGAELDEQARALLDRGTDPADPEAHALARRWADLVDDMSGGDLRAISALYAKLDGLVRMPRPMAWSALKRGGWSRARGLSVPPRLTRPPAPAGPGGATAMRGAGTG